MARNYSHQNIAAVCAAYKLYLRTQNSQDTDRDAALDRYFQACSSLTHNQKRALVAKIRNEVQR